uniref:Uncharacterized protein n=1 Tax=Arion vulgaris TaxID=1028688 RepID=A0A0B7B171_9EUPU
MLQIRKLKYFGHIQKRHKGFEKTIMEGGIHTKRRGRPWQRRMIQNVRYDLNMTAVEV